MPYVTQDRRLKLDRRVQAAQPTDPDTQIKVAGELNYLVTRLVEQYRAEHGSSYATFNDIAGALTNARDEFYRRVVAPYEDGKALDNGDVYANPLIAATV